MQMTVLDEKFIRINQDEAIRDVVATSEKIEKIIDAVARTARTKNGIMILMPSLKVLMQCFNCSYKEIRHALDELSGKGYQTIIPGMYGHISLMRPSR